ncbi:T9SS type A sorting domain-containing protein [candidate division KSB1 bacterium]|nr:T9SS type A sorting domain-containing protein [candidate division KSB1 bacterium]
MKHLVTLFTFIMITSGMIFAQGAGNALEFNGTDYVNCGSSSSLKPSDVLTIEAWVRPDDDSHAGGGDGLVVSDGDGSATGVNLDLQTSQVPYCIINTADGLKSVSGNAISPATWEHVAFVFSPVGLFLYQNGSLVDSEPFPSGSNSIVTTANNFYIGSKGSGTDRRFLGDIDEVRVWHAALTQPNINAWKSKPVTSSHPNWGNMVSYYKFDEDKVGQTTGTCVDSKGSNDGTNSGALWFTNNDLPLPVELTSFKVNPAPDGSGIELHWITASELDNLGFEIIRRENIGETWQVIASYKTYPELEGQGTVTYETHYNYTDRNVDKNRAYQYSIVSVNVNGDRDYSQAVEISLSGVTVTDFKLYPAYPNPFNPSTVISYFLKNECEVNLRVVDIHGRAVRTLRDGLLHNSGFYSVTWDGFSDEGLRISSGVYFIILEAGRFSGSQKVLFLK